MGEIGALLVWAQGNSPADQDGARRQINPYDEVLERMELRENYSPIPARYLLGLKGIPQWVRAALPFAEIVKVAHDGEVSLPEGVDGVYGSPDLFLCWVRRLDGLMLRAGWFALREPTLAGKWATVASWDGGRRISIMVPVAAAACQVVIPYREESNG